MLRMLIDYTPLTSRQRNVSELAADITLDNLIAATAEAAGPMNAVAAALLGLVHEAGQFAQLREIISQARAAS